MSTNASVGFCLVKPHLGIKILPPHLSLTFARTSTIDTPHCPLDPCRLDRRNHPALDALQVHLVLFLRVSILSADDFFLAVEQQDRHVFCHTFRAATRSARASPVSERLPLAKRAIYLTGLARRCGAKTRDSGGRAYVNGALLLRVEHVCVSRRPAEFSTAWGPATSAPRRWAAARRNTHNVRLVACFTTSPTAEGDTRLVRT